MYFFQYLYDKIILRTLQTIIGTCGFPVALVFCFTKLEKTMRCAVKIVLRILALFAIMMIFSAAYATISPSSDIGYLITPILTGVTGLALFRDEPLIDRLVRMSLIVSVQAYSTPLFFPITYWEMQINLLQGAYPLTSFLQCVVFAAIVFMTKKKSIGKFDSVNVNFLVLTESVSVIGYVMNGLAVAFSDKKMMDQPFGFGFFTGGGLLVVQILTYIIFLRLMNGYNERQILLAEEQRSKSELKLLKNYEISYNAMKSVRHDIKNQYGYVCALIDTGEYERAKNYLKSIGETIDAANARTFCGNNIINIALNMAAERAERLSVTLDTKVAVPDTLEIDDAALGSVLTNLLNNAIDSVKTMPDENKRVEACISVKDGYLLIRTINAVDESKIHVENGILLTSKKDKNMHGIGTKIVSRLSERADGCFAYKIENGCFIADVMMKNGGTEKDEK